jgi:hypothetical protein
MRSLLTVFVLLTLTGATRVSNQGRWIIDSSSQLLIHGKSNVNSFTCSIPNYDHVDTLNYRVKNGDLIFDNNKMVIPIRNFNCGNNVITKDLRRTVKAVDNPYLTIAIVSMDDNAGRSRAVMKITLAGVTKLASIEFIQTTHGELLQLTGKHAVTFKDFGLVAPKHLLGLVKVQQELNVEFNLLIKTIP